MVQFNNQLTKLFKKNNQSEMEEGGSVLCLLGKMKVLWVYFIVK